MPDMNVSLKWKTAVPIICAVAIGVVVTVFVSGYKAREIVLDEMKSSVLNGYRDTVLNSLTTMMATGNFKDSKKDFLEQMKKILDVKVVKTEAVDKDYGKGEPNEYASGDMEQEVIKTGKEQVFLKDDTIVGIYPYVAKSDFMGKNCLSCHQVKEGEVLGAVIIKLPLKESFGRIRQLQYLYMLLGGLGIAATIGLVLLVVGYTLRPLSVLAKTMTEAANRETGLVLNYQDKDEVLRITNIANKVIDSFSTTINGIVTLTGRLLPLVDVMKKVSEQTSTAAGNQAGQAAMIATAAEEMTQTINDIARNAAAAADTSNNAMSTAQQGKDVADGAVETVNRVYTCTVDLASSIETLNNRVGEIGNIVTVIKEIADQTNLLALNAAIEAARAGEQGRGFSVVADEVRKLAERTIRATNEISGKITAVRADSESTSKSMEDASAEVSRATEYIRQVGDSLNRIVESVKGVSDQITHIATAVEEQSSASEEVKQNIDKTSEIAREMEDMSRNVMTEINKMTGITEELRGMTAGVKTRSGALVMIHIATNDHKNFVGKIHSHLANEARLEPDKLPNHQTCRFGKWYYSQGREICGNLPSFGRIEPVHEKVHKVAKEAVAKTNSGDAGGANRLFKELETASGDMINLLAELKKECST